MSGNFFMYKGYPLVRNKDTIYYGNMYDEYVIMLNIVDKHKAGNLDISEKIKVYQISTDEKLNPMERIIKSTEKDSLYEALDLAKVWLERSTEK